MALACQIPLRNFLTKLEKYNASMNPFTTGFSFRSAAHKAKWALFLNEDVLKLRNLIAAKVLSINLLLTTQVWKTVCHIEGRAKENDQGVAEKLTGQRHQLDRVEAGINDLDQRLAREQTATNQKISDLGATTTTSNAAILSLRDISGYISTFLASFPQEFRGFIQRVLQDNWNMYQVLLQIRDRIPAQPTTLIDSNIKFEDALGRTKELPYEFFRHWEVDIAQEIDGFSFEEEETLITSRQADEDTKLYGARPEPLDVFELADVNEFPRNRGQKRRLSAANNRSSHPTAKFPKQDTSHFAKPESRLGTTDVSYGNIDWDAGHTPLDTWLRQSAIPLNAKSGNETQQDESPSWHHHQNELAEVEVFRRVHIAQSNDRKTRATSSLEMVADGLSDEGQIYLRNIMDRYSSIPVYLARRLAQANCERADRLGRRRAQENAWLNTVLCFEHADLKEMNVVTSSKRLSSDAPQIIEALPKAEGAFWTGTGRCRRPSSAHSSFSSRNSSLRDVPHYDPLEQQPYLPRKQSECSSHEAFPVRPSLPPPPKEAGECSPFECDICGEIITISRKLDWQRHVLEDIKPYISTHQDGDQYMFHNRYALMLAEVELYSPGERWMQDRVYRSDRFLFNLPEECMFCQQSTGKRVKDYIRHISRHMEEIAFVVVPRQYEDWAFYSDDASDRMIPKASK
ncbi:MAG: hypothetical protein Q9220_001335 [cf. Caloplaca sp. 1 TL-2023]